MIKRVLYVGGDENFLGEFEAKASAHDMKVYVSGVARKVQPIWEQLYAVVLDCDALPDPAAGLAELRDAHPHAAIIVLDGMRKLPMTHVSLARMHGAESFHWKPIQDWTQLLGALNGAFDRMSRWHRLMDHFESEAAERATVESAVVYDGAGVS